MQNVYGYTPEELINQNIFRLLFFPEDLQNVIGLLDYSFLVEKGSKFKKTQRTKSGRLIDANLEWEIRVLNNKTYGVFTVTNITPHDPHKNQFLVNSNYQKKLSFV